jgi:hypothetical protein
VKRRRRAALVIRFDKQFFSLMRSPSYTPLDLNNIVHKYFIESGRKKKKTGNSWSQRLSVPKFSGTEKKKKLCAYMCVCIYIRLLFLFSLVVRDAPATGNIPVVSFPP